MRCDAISASIIWLRRRPPGGDGVERLAVPAEEEGLPAGVVRHLVRGVVPAAAPPAALQQLPRLHHAVVAKPDALHPGGLHPARPPRQPLVPLLALRALPRHHAADLLPEHQPLGARPLPRAPVRLRRRRALQAVEQRRVVVERLLEPLHERGRVVVRLRLRHHHDLGRQRPHRAQEAPQLRRLFPLLLLPRHRRRLRRDREHRRVVRAQLQPRVELPLQQLAEAAGAGARDDLHRGEAAAARDVHVPAAPAAAGVVGRQEAVQLPHHADGQRLAGAHAEEVPQRVRVQVLQPGLHGAELERDVERLGLPGEHAGHAGQELLGVVHGRDAEVRGPPAAAAEGVEQRDPLHRVGGGAGEVDDVHEPLPLHGLQDGVVGGEVGQLHEGQHVEEVAPRGGHQVRLRGAARPRGQQRPRQAWHQVEQLPRQRVGEDGGEALQRVRRVQRRQLRDLLKVEVGAVEGARRHLRRALVQQADEAQALLVVAQLLHPRRPVRVRRRRAQRRRRRRRGRRQRVLLEHVHVGCFGRAGACGQLMDRRCCCAGYEGTARHCWAWTLDLGVATNVLASLQGSRVHTFRGG
uniref:Uncharacterized protein n=1 Tax=Zea mays TaxID=4577 RepID=C0PKR6_MAIZE|nr:unknown [Zea mays]